MTTPSVTVKESKAVNALGVFANTALKKGTLIETCPLILVPIKDLEHIRNTKLYYYYFEYTDKQLAIMLGYGSLYNHSYTPNAKYIYNYKKKFVKVIAIKPIGKGEEIFFNYNFDPSDKQPLGDWFKTGY